MNLFYFQIDEWAESGFVGADTAQVEHTQKSAVSWKMETNFQLTQG